MLLSGSVESGLQALSDSLRPLLSHFSLKLALLPSAVRSSHDQFGLALMFGRPTPFSQLVAQFDAKLNQLSSNDGHNIHLLTVLAKQASPADIDIISACISFRIIMVCPTYTCLMVIGWMEKEVFAASPNSSLSCSERSANSVILAETDGIESR